MWAKDRNEDGILVQYWRSRHATFDPEIHPLPDVDIPIAENELVFDENAGERPRTSGGGRGRFYGKGDSYETFSKLVHSLNNLAWGQGGWRWTRQLKTNKEVPRIAVIWRNTPRQPTPQVAMGLALNGQAKACEAWEYANSVGVNTPNNGQNYEWCHLLGHGLGGKETVENLVAATHACNTEQLCIERWLRDMAARRIKCEVHINAQMAREGAHLAEGIGYSVYGPKNGPLLYYKWLDGRRTVEPSPSERDKVWGILQAAYKKNYGKK